MPFSKGDMVLVDYSVFVKETGELIETTSEEVAKKHNKYDPKAFYEPVLIVIGEGRALPAFEEAVAEAEVGEEKEVEIPPEKAYGERREDYVKVFTIRQLRRALGEEKVRELSVGDEIAFGDTVGRVISITGGRVTIDFNHPLAGKTLILRFKVVKKLEDVEEKIRYLAARRFRVPAKDIVASFNEETKTAAVEIPRRTLATEDLGYRIVLAAGDIIKWVKEVEKVAISSLFTRNEFEPEKKEEGENE